MGAKCSAPAGGPGERVRCGAKPAGERDCAQLGREEPGIPFQVGGYAPFPCKERESQ